MKDDARRRQWANEYEHLKAIQLDYTEETPTCVTLASPHLQPASGRECRRILDVGCGKGRVGIHLALAGFHVTGFDLVPSALAEFERVARELKIEDRVQLFELSMNDAWPVADGAMDCVFLVTVLDNLTERTQEEHARTETLRVLRPEGLVVTQFYLLTDGYYGPLLEASPRRDEGLLVDPNNGITFRIHTPHDIRSILGSRFELCSSQEIVSQDLKYGAVYPRSSQTMIFRKTASAER